MIEQRKLSLRRNFEWPVGGPDLALCDEAGVPLAGQRSLALAPLPGAEEYPQFGLLTVTFVVGTDHVRWFDD